jgi:hypothetical protein
MSLEQSNAELMQALHFTPEDLAANRSGRPSPGQVQRWEAERQATLQHLAKARAPSIMPFVVLGVVLAVAGVALVVTGGLQALQKEYGALVLPILIAVPVVLILVTVVSQTLGRAQAGQAQQRLAAAPPVASTPVQTVTGKVKTKTRSGDENSVDTYEVHVEGVRFDVSRTVMKAFHNGKLYRVYYREEGRRPRLASAEALEG